MYIVTTRSQKTEMYGSEMYEWTEMCGCIGS